MRSGKHYKKITTPDGRDMDEHRYKMELHVGRKLSRFEIVHHIDENINNNDISNLQLMTLGEHTRHHLKTLKRDEIKFNAKLSEDQVIKIREAFLKGGKLKELAKAYNVHFSTISHIINLKSFAHINKDGLNERLLSTKRTAQIAKLKNYSF